MATFTCSGISAQVAKFDKLGKGTDAACQKAVEAGGSLLAKKAGMSFVDLDAYIEKKEHKTVSQIFADSGEDYLYSMTNPRPLDGSSPGGVWEIVED